MQKFSEVVEFAAVDGTRQYNQYKNLFGLNTRTRFGVTELYERLKDLLSDFHKNEMPIPKLCTEISAHLTRGHGKGWFGANMLDKRKAKSRFVTYYSEILEAVSNFKGARSESRRVQAALQELHSQGYIIFFPLEETHQVHGTSNKANRESAGKDSTDNILVITDTNWFSNKFVGSLLATHLRGLPKRSCSEQHLEEILRYLERLELCVSLDNSTSRAKVQLLFPALLKENTIDFTHASKASFRKFFGRRFKCMDTSIHLIPFAIFTRLQVKLHKAFSADNRSFRHGYGWVSFMRRVVGVVVRFGGDVINEVWECKQWIDILVFCPEDHGINTPSTSASLQTNENYQSRHMDDERFIASQEVIDEIRRNLFAACKEGNLGGIPTVSIEEMVLQNETAKSDSQRLSSIMDKVRTQAPAKHFQEWEMGAVEALVKGVPNVEGVPNVDVEQLKRCRPDEEERQEVIAAILANKEVDMWADFSLKRVIVDDDGKDGCHRSFWVCDRHAGDKAVLRPIANPFNLS